MEVVKFKEWCSPESQTVDKIPALRLFPSRVISGTTGMCSMFRFNYFSAFPRTKDEKRSRSIKKTRNKYLKFIQKSLWKALVLVLQYTAMKIDCLSLFAKLIDLKMLSAWTSELIMFLFQNTTLSMEAEFSNWSRSETRLNEVTFVAYIIDDENFLGFRFLRQAARLLPLNIFDE